MFQRILLSIFSLFSISFASDPITMDSLFKKQVGLRSITSISYLSSGNAYIYNMYPTLIAQPDTKTWTDTKQVSISQTFIYTLVPKFDILVAGNGSYKQNEYVSNLGFSYNTERSFNFDSLWIGGIYTGNNIGGVFIPQITLQSGVIQREKHFDESKSFTFKSFSAQFALKNYSDPVVSSVYIGGVYNANRNFDYGKLDYFEGRKTSNSYSIPTFSLGTTYSLNSDTAISISGTAGGSSSAPDSVFTISLWKKF